MRIEENILLAPYTTFKIGGPAKFFCVVKDQFDALEAYEFAAEKNLPTFVLGGGSNILISDDGYDGLVIRVVNKGIEVFSESAADVLLKVASGEVWDEVVSFAVKNNWWGIENLSHIPGSSGAIAVQNVGAYGQEASQVIESVTVFERQTRQILSLGKTDCNFGYRASIFNTTLANRYIIFSINFCLHKNGAPNLGYRDLRKYFNLPDVLPAPADFEAAAGRPEFVTADERRGDNLSLAQIRQAIIEIRDKKFPFPAEAKKGNAGSFFKNPVLNQIGYDRLLKIVGLNFGPMAVGMLKQKVFRENGFYKVPAAFLIDLCGLKNLRSGGAAINQNQPLVIINKSGLATASDVLDVAGRVRQAVSAKTGVALNYEPLLVGFK